MARATRDAEARGELRVRGLGLTARFALAMSLSLAVVMGIAGWTLHGTATRIAINAQEDTLARGVLLTEKMPRVEQDGEAREHAETGVSLFPVRYGEQLEQRGTLYKHVAPASEGGASSSLLVPGAAADAGNTLMRLIFAVMVIVVFVGAGVALWIGNRVASPLGDIVDDIRQIARGNLAHRTGVHGGGEIELLARTVDRMARDLAEAREAELELSIRQHEVELAAGVRDALLPSATPEVAGLDVGAAHLSSGRFGGDFYDTIELGEGRLGLLVCDVSGQGMPAALIGAAARSYLRAELQHGLELDEALRRVNRELARDVRRGMFVTALYALIDVPRANVRVVCAGHKVPLLRYCAADRKLRAIQPEGIALGLDRGPVFDRALRVQDVPLEPGDRLLLASTGPLRIQNAQGAELGEKGFYALVLRHAALPTGRFVKALKASFDEHAQGTGLPADVSLVTVLREA